MAAVDLLEQEDGIEFSPFEFTEFAVRLKGKPIAMGRRPWLGPIYNMPYLDFPGHEHLRRKIMLMFGRQSEKSTTLGNQLIAFSALEPHLRSLYVTASNVQMREFSDERLRVVLQDSPILSRLAGIGVPGAKETQNVLTKRFRNGSKIVLRSVYKNADRARGIPADLLCIDELQDIHVDDLPVIEETLFHSEIDGGPVSIYSGTPKTFDNPIEFYFSRFSTMNEWMPRCSHCGKWNVVGEKHIGPTGLVCEQCGKELNPVDGQAQWVRMGKSTQEWEGFHLCQPIVVYAYRHLPKIFSRFWRDILNKKQRYNRARFANEVMGRSFDAGTKPVTLDEVRSCAVGPEMVLAPDRRLRSTHTWAGIDWGTGDESFTIISIWRYDTEGRFQMLYAKRYEGYEADADHSINDMIRIIKKYNVTRIGADWGFGFGMNNQLKKVFGPMKVMLFFHANAQKEKIKVDSSGGKFITHRTQVLQDIFTLIKKGPVSGGIVFPPWAQFETFANDILSVYSEYSEASRQIVFGHPRGVPDDFLHTAVYAFLVSQFDHPRPDINAPSPSSAKHKPGRKR